MDIWTRARVGAVIVVWTLTVVTILVSSAFWAGRQVERSAELGQVIRLQIVERNAWEAIHALDSIAMRYQIAAHRATHPVKNSVSQSRK